MTELPWQVIISLLRSELEEALHFAHDLFDAFFDASLTGVRGGSLSGLMT